jgi:hypothetical protein
MRCELLDWMRAVPLLLLFVLRFSLRVPLAVGLLPPALRRVAFPETSCCFLLLVQLEAW